MLRKRDVELRRLRNLLGDLLPLSIRSKRRFEGWTDENGMALELPFSWLSLVDGDAPVAFLRDISLQREGGKSVYLRAWFGGESLLLVDGEPYGEFNEFHTEVDLTPLADGRAHTLRVETVARGLFGSRADGVFRYAYLITYDESVRRALNFVRNVLDVATETADEDFARTLIEALDQLLSSTHAPLATGAYLSTLSENPEALSLVTSTWSPPQIPDEFEFYDGDRIQHFLISFRNFLGELEKLKTRFPKVGHAYIAGHSHIDYAWLWPVDETKRKILRTFANAIRLAEKFPNFLFIQSSAQMYQDLKELSPVLFEKVRALVKSGNWEPVGGMWVEADCNIVSVESLIRQFLYGQRFFEREFGKKSDVAWLPDVFGFPWTLPQVLKTCGVEYFFTTKLNWSEFNRFPHDLCIWRGIDGSEVLYYSFNNPENSYNGSVSARSLLRTYENFRGKHTTKRYYFTFGHGDGGGGPTEEMCMSVEPLNEIPGIPYVSYATPRGFVEELNRELDTSKLPVWDDELYLELHRATYTSQSRLKRLHRIAEDELRTTEIINATVFGDAQEWIDELWKVLLRNQFHDILPGSSIGRVYERAMAEVGNVVQLCRERQTDYFKAPDRRGDSPGTGQRCLTLFNPSSFSQPIRFELGEPVKVTGLSILGYDESGGVDAERASLIEGARTSDGNYLYTSQTKIPPLGYATVSYVPMESGEPSEPNLGSERTVGGDIELENEFLVLRIFEDGSVNVLDKRIGRWALRGRGHRLAIYSDVPAFWDNWDTDVRSGEYPLFLRASKVSLVEKSALRQVVSVLYEFGETSIAQNYILERDLDFVTVKTKVDWHHRRALLKAVFETDVLARRARFDIDGGYIERPTHRNTSWEVAKFEVPGHRWVDLSQYDHGVCVLNDSRYGHSVSGSVIELTLLKSGIYPDFYSDEGEHEFSYAIYPHAHADVLEFYRRSEQLTRPLKVFSGAPIVAPLTIRLTPERLRILSLRRLGDTFAVRVLEPLGGNARVRFETPGFQLRRVTELNGLDEEIDSLDFSPSSFELDLAPFKIRTVGLRVG